MTLINSAKTAIDALNHEDSGIRYHSAWWLGKHRIKSAVPKLVQCLNDERDRTAAGGYPLRRQAARSLGMIGDSSCIPALLQTLQTKDVQLHEATLRALIAINNNDCIGPLITYLDRQDINKPIEALIETLTTFKACHVRDKIEPFLDSDSERIASSAASFFFICTGEASYLENVITLLDHNNRFIRQAAAFDLARIATISSADAILEANIPNNIKMFAIKAILCELSNQQSDHTSEESPKKSALRSNLFARLDALIKENFSGNLPTSSQETRPQGRQEDWPKTTQNPTPEAFSMLREPSLSSRIEGIKLLVRIFENNHKELSKLYFSESDQDIKMGIIKAMSELKNPSYLPAFVDAIGVEIGNHCQGNIRRVAANALGEIGSIQREAEESLSLIIEKLNWTLNQPDDWGLRYSACLALEKMSSIKAKNLLISAKDSEPDPVVASRISMALAEGVDHCN